ncbi:MAG: hypothetical protein HIU84_09060 [Acidobacteria bacterium]|nr:hypothetical protein [Acidobacteriota bacterium]
MKIRQTSNSPAYKPLLAPISSTQTLAYLLLKNGTVEAPLENQLSLQHEVSYRGHLLFPSIAEMKSGISDVSTLHFALSPLSSTGVAEFELLTKGHVKTVMGVESMRISGDLRQSITTPSGTFHNVVGLRESITNFRVENAINAQVATALDSAVLKDSGVNTTTIWYAPGRGAVSMWTVSSTGKTTIEDSHCAG